MKPSENRDIGEPRLTLDDLLDLWQDHDEDITVNLTTGEAFYHNHVIVNPDEDGNWQPGEVLAWMGHNRYYPNVWLISDHGNADLVSISENGDVAMLGGIV